MARSVVGRFCETPIEFAAGVRRGGRPTILTERGRRVREDVRVEEEWLDPGGGQRCDCSEANIELRSTDEWRLSRVLVIT